MKDELIDYQRLANLLRSQKDALEKDDSAKLAALLPLIEQYSRRVSPERGNPPDASPLIDEILQLAGHNHQAYQQRRQGLSKMQSQLRTAGRYLEQVRRSRPSSQPRANWTG